MYINSNALFTLFSNQQLQKAFEILVNRYNQDVEESKETADERWSRNNDTSSTLKVTPYVNPVHNLPSLRKALSAFLKRRLDKEALLAKKQVGYMGEFPSDLTRIIMKLTVLRPPFFIKKQRRFTDEPSSEEESEDSGNEISSSDEYESSSEED